MHRISIDSAVRLRPAHNALGKSVSGVVVDQTISGFHCEVLWTNGALSWYDTATLELVTNR